MREIRASLPMIVGVSRAMAGVGIGLLLADRLGGRRRAIGAALFGVGALSTIPIAIDLFRHKQTLAGEPTIANVPQSGVDPSEGLRAD